MRVVGGTAKGQRLLMVPGPGTRPIMDRVKTSLFDMLRPRIAEARVLDLFAGSGSVGIEALSQGAARCVFLDLSRRAIETIRKNLAATGLADRAEVGQHDAFQFLARTEEVFDLIYVAPPQYKKLWEQAVAAIALRPQLLERATGEDDVSGLVIVQVDPREYVSLDFPTLRETRRKAYGNTLLVSFEPLSNLPAQGVDSGRSGV